MNGGAMRGPVGVLTQNGKHGWARSPWVFVVCLLVVVGLFVSKLPQLPSTPTTPSGLELELPGTADGALAVLRAFDDAGVLASARVAIYWDFLLILAYSIGLASLLEWVAARDRRPDALIGYAAWGALLAGACDVLENCGMLFTLSIYPTPSALFSLAALLGTLASLAKWTLLCAIVGYAVWEIPWSLGRPSPRDTPIAEPRPKPVGSGTGAEQGIQPVPVTQPAPSWPDWKAVFGDDEPEDKEEKNPSPQKGETT
jgi:hypothetical protein